MAEPVFYTAIRPKAGTRATGIGDLEITLSYLFAREKGSRPALAIAGEVKVPTARNILIGTRKADFTTSLIASKRFGKFDAHANVGYTFVGKPAGANLKNFFNFALAGEYFVRPKFTLVGEVLANTGSSPEAGTISTITSPIITPEVSSGELVGILGFRYRIRERVFFTFGVSYDNNHAVLLRPGITFYFNRPGSPGELWLSRIALRFADSLSAHRLSYSVRDAEQNFVGVRNSDQTRFPSLFALDAEFAKEFQVTKKYGVHLSLRGFNLTEHFNPRDVRSNIADPHFREFFASYRRYFTGGFDILF